MRMSTRMDEDLTPWIRLSQKRPGTIGKPEAGKAEVKRRIGHCEGKIDQCKVPKPKKQQEDCRQRNVPGSGDGNSGMKNLTCRKPAS